MNERFLSKRMLALLGLGVLCLVGLACRRNSDETPEEPHKAIGGPQSYMVRGGGLETVEYLYSDANGDLGKVGDKDLRSHYYDIDAGGRTIRSPLFLKRVGDQKIGTSTIFLYEPIVYDIRLEDEWKPRNLCQGQRFPMPGGPADAFEGKAVAIPGHWLSEPIAKSRSDLPVTLSCASGVVGKCILRGYVPSDKEPSKQELFRACLYASRSQPNKAGTTHTCNGTIIDIYDEQGIQPIDPSLPATYTFEAAWNQDGLVCMNHPRYSGCTDALPKVPKCPDDIAQGNKWSAFNKRILIKTRSVMVEGACPNTPEAIASVCK